MNSLNKYKNDKKIIEDIFSNNLNKFDIHFIYEYVLSVKLFKDLTLENSFDLIKNILKSVNLKVIESDKVVIKQEDINQMFYIIISGGGDFYQFSKKRSKLKNENLFEELKNNEFFIDPQTHEFKHEKVKKIIKGDCFGELQLIFNQVNSYSFITNEQSVIGFINKSDFNNFIKPIINEKIQEQQKFFSNLLKNSFNMFDVMSISSYFQLRLFNVKDIVVNEETKINQLYLISKGRVQLIKKKLINNTLLDENNLESQDIKKLLKLNRPITLNEKNNNTIKKSFSIDSIKKKNEKIFQTAVTLLESGEYTFIGLKEFIKKIPNFEYSVKCISNIEVYCININDMYKLILNFSNFQPFIFNIFSKQLIYNEVLS